MFQKSTLFRFSSSSVIKITDARQKEAGQGISLPGLCLGAVYFSSAEPLKRDMALCTPARTISWAAWAARSNTRSITARSGAGKVESTQSARS